MRCYLLWRAFWDVVFAVASLLLAIFYGTALGNVVRGVPIDADGNFPLPLWTNLQPGSDPGIIDWYTLLVGLTALVALTIHGALWVSLKTEGDLQARCQAVARRFWFLLLPLVLLTSMASWRLPSAPSFSRSSKKGRWQSTLCGFQACLCMKR